MNIVAIFIHIQDSDGLENLSVLIMGEDIPALPNGPIWIQGFIIHLEGDIRYFLNIYIRIVYMLDVGDGGKEIIANDVNRPI